MTVPQPAGGARIERLKTRPDFLKAAKAPALSRGAVFMQITADYARGSSGGPVLDAYGNALGMVASTSPVFTAPPIPPAGAKDIKPSTPSQQMVRHNCATARAILELTGQK